MLCQLSNCCLGQCVDWCADRGRRAVRKNGGLNRGKRCDDMWTCRCFLLLPLPLLLFFFFFVVIFVTSKNFSVVRNTGNQHQTNKHLPLAPLQKICRIRQMKKKIHKQPPKQQCGLAQYIMNMNEYTAK